MEKIRKRVVAVWGSFEARDFVLEPTCSDECMCEVCKEGFWIERVEDD